VNTTQRNRILTRAAEFLEHTTPFANRLALDLRSLIEYTEESLALDVLRFGRDLAPSLGWHDVEAQLGPLHGCVRWYDDDGRAHYMDVEDHRDADEDAIHELLVAHIEEFVERLQREHARGREQKR
jgi:hypothetical protein